MYAQKELKRLWKFLAPAYRNKAYTGLQSVAFSEPLESFEPRYKSRALRDDNLEATITTSVDAALAILQPTELRFHHLSCAGENGGENSVLCIHYETPTHKGVVALLGIDYTRAP